MGRSQRLVGRALRTTGSLSGRGGSTARRVSSALRARHITLSLRQLSLQIVNLCLEGLQIRTTCHSHQQHRGSRRLHNARALHTSPLWVVDSGCLDNRCDSGGQVPPSSPPATAANLFRECNCDASVCLWPATGPTCSAYVQRKRVAAVGFTSRALLGQRESVCAVANLANAALASAGAWLQPDCRKFFKSF